jgi:hypothetical protein
MEALRKKVNETVKNLYYFYDIWVGVAPAKSPLQMWNVIEELITDEDLALSLDWAEIIDVMAFYRDGDFECSFRLIDFSALVNNLNKSKPKPKTWDRALALQQNVKSLKARLDYYTLGELEKKQELRDNIKLLFDNIGRGPDESAILEPDRAMSDYRILNDFIEC